MPYEPGLRKALTTPQFSLFRDWIHEHSGIFMEETKMDSLRVSLVTRANLLGYSDYGDYFEFLSGSESEFKELMNLVTINETSFFRFPAQFEALRDVVVPEILEGREPSARRVFRVWSAGCSTGEEPYTIGMTLRDTQALWGGYDVEVHGTDVSTQALDRARSAIYPARSVAELDSDVVARHFEPIGSSYRPAKPVRELCNFHYHNLIKERFPLAFMGNWDVIFCRNVTIYFTIDSTRRLVDSFYDALNPGGYLFIGHSETLTTVCDRFETIETGGIFLYRKPLAKRSVSFEDIVAKRRGEQIARTAQGSRQRDVSIGGGNAAVTPQSNRRKTPARETPQAPAVEPAPVQSLAEGDFSALIEQAHVLLDQADAAGAYEMAEKALAARPDDMDAHVVAAFALSDMGRLDAAAEQAHAALKVNPLAAPARYILGVIRQEGGDPHAALAEFKRTLYIDHDFVLAHFAMANIHRQRGEMGPARRSYENALRSLYAQPDGQWTRFMGGFRPDLLAKTCERGLLECGKGA